MNRMGPSALPSSRGIIRAVMMPSRVEHFCP